VAWHNMTRQNMTTIEMKMGKSYEIDLNKLKIEKKKRNRSKRKKSRRVSVKEKRKL
jgi:hypothetical protein